VEVQTYSAGVQQFGEFVLPNLANRGYLTEPIQMFADAGTAVFLFMRRSGTPGLVNGGGSP